MRIEKLESDLAMVIEGVLSKIRRLSPEEMSSSKRGEKMGWVQWCPFCDIWVGGLVDHVKSAHRDKSSRQIRTLCPHENCGKMVVDIRNHIRMVHDKVKNSKCEQCPSVFFNNYQMLKHVEAVHTNMKVECGECGGVFKSTTLQSHIRRIHMGIKPTVPCTNPDCDKVFGSKADLERHMVGIHMQWKAPCPECGKKFKMQTLITHIKTAHMGIYNFQCQQCGQGFQNQKQLETHVRVKHNGTYLYCRAITNKGDECGKILFSEEGLINHVECKHMSGPASTKVHCKECPSEVHACYLLHHVTSVHSDPGTVECVVKECGDRLSDSVELRNHMYSVHHSLALEWCEQCGQFVLKLADHNKLQHQVNLPFQPVHGVCTGHVCDWEGCTFMGFSGALLAKHVKIEHKKIVSGKCERCGGKKVFNMVEHVRVHHDKVKTLPCDVCGKLFLKKGLLNMHKKIHFNNKETCNECGVKVMNLRQHQRFVHEKDLPYKCEEPGCETKFTSTHGLKQHKEHVHQMIREECTICHKQVTKLKKHIQIVHEKLREHQCTECPKDFQAKSHLRNHVARVHLGLREPCPECGKLVQDVRNHINFVHNKVANFPCDQCSTTCLTSTSLKMHVSSVHLKEKINCPQCGITVACAYLAAHIRRKHSDKMQVKFTCSHCGKFLFSRGQLAKHITRVHMGVREKCSICGLMTKDLKRHNRNTNCGREGYVPRAIKDEKSLKTEHSGGFLKQENGDVKQEISFQGSSEIEDWEDKENDFFEESDNMIVEGNGFTENPYVMNNNTSTKTELRIKPDNFQYNCN